MQRKAAGKPSRPSSASEKPDNVISLMDALKQSLKGKGAAKRGRIPGVRRAPQRRAARKAHRSAARARKAG